MEIWEDDDGNTESQHSCKYGVRVVYYEIINDKIRLLFCFSVGRGAMLTRYRLTSLHTLPGLLFAFCSFAFSLFCFFAL